MKVIPVVAASAAALAITGGVATAADSHGHHLSNRPTTAVRAVPAAAAASPVDTTRTAAPIPAIGAKALTTLSRSGVKIRRVPSVGRTGVVPLSVVGRHAAGFQDAVEEGRVHASLARVSVTNFGRVKNPSSATKVTMQEPDVDGDLAWVITYDADDFEFTMPTSVAAQIENPDQPAKTEIVSASAISIYDAHTGNFLYWSIY